MFSNLYIDICKCVYGNNPFYSYSTPICIQKAVLKNTGLQKNHIIDDQIRLLLEKRLRGVPSACMGNRPVKRGEKEIVCEDMTDKNGWSMSDNLPTGDYSKIEFTKSNERTLSKTNIRTPDQNKCGCLLECDLEYPSKIHERTKHIPFLQDKKTIEL